MPRISLEFSSYTVREPVSADDITTAALRVVRSGDLSSAAEVRVSTRDGSALSGIDYTATSQAIRFRQG